MKKGKTLSELATELQRQSDAKENLVAPASSVTLDDTACSLEVGDKTYRSINDTAHNQIGVFTDIPKKYYNKMRENEPELLAGNVNTWLDKSDKTRMVRTMDGTVRAFLSDRYRRSGIFQYIHRPNERCF